MSAKAFAASLESEFQKKYPAPESGTKADLGGIALTLWDYSSNNTIQLSGIFIPKVHRGKGVGTEMMNRIIKYADSVGKRITLTPSTDFGGSSVSRLKRFYKSFGFVLNKGRNKDFTISDVMYRSPR